MQYLISILLLGIIFIIYNLYISRNIQEKFTVTNLINNGDFNNGEHIDGLVSKENNFIIISKQNPGETSFVLKQSKFNHKSYQTNINVDKNRNYNLSLWLHTSKYYDGTSHNILEILGNEHILSNKGQIVKTNNINNTKWYNIVYKFNSNNNDKINIKIGGTSKFSKGYRLYSNLSLNAEIQNLNEFEHTNKLKLLFMFDKPISSSKIKSKLGDLDLNLASKPTLIDNALKLKNIQGSIAQTKDILNNEFSIIYTYKGEEYENGNLINGSAINDINSGLDIDVKNNIGINNNLIITVGSVQTTFDVGIINKFQNYFILYKNKEIELYIDGVKINPNNTTSLINKKNKGICPDGWKYLGNKRCQALEVNKGTCDKTVKFKGKLNNEEKEKWAKACNVTWKNCSILTANSVASHNNNNCKENDDLIFSHLPIKINKDLNLSGFLKSLIIYDRKISTNEINDINTFLILKNLDKKLVNKLECVTNRPSLSNAHSVSKDIEFSGGCPFDDHRLCRIPACQCINWNKLDNITHIPKACKDVVNKYCRNNYSDNMCNRLRKNMCSIKNNKNKNDMRNDKQIIKYLKSKLFSFADKKYKKISNLNYKIHSLEDKLKIEQDKVKNQEDKLKQMDKKSDCKSCESKVDLSKYIRKDKIPCWGCKL